ncbi:hypothetical protein ACFU93_46335 [Streptomyces sp. NPDC057611]|uniref:hypothetical protein n=1 Tax=Streptomyces sp. NPDC057611 TaxID=3346182 RepID=UPI0036B49379
MGEIVVVYEVDKAVATRVPRGEKWLVRRVHAAPAAPGSSDTIAWDLGLMVGVLVAFS